MSSHLSRRGGIWWARLAVPERLRDLAGRREFSQSTKTHEVHIAKLVASILVANWRRQLLELECCPMTPDILKLIGPASALTAGTHLPIAAAVESTGIKQAELLRLSAGGQMPLFCRVSQVTGYVLSTEVLELVNFEQGPSGGYVLPSLSQMPVSASEVVLSCLLAIPTFEVKAIAGAILAEGLDAVDLLAFDAPDAPGKLFVPNDAVRVGVGALEVRADAVAIVHRRIGARITADQIERAQAAQATSVKGAAMSVGKNANKRFSEALEAYATTSSGIPGCVVSLTEQGQKRRGCALFIELVGDLALADVTADRLRAFREALKSLPAKPNNIRKKYQRETMKATFAALRDDGVPWSVMSESAQHERMQWVNQMFRWLVAQEWLKENPMASVLGEQTKTAVERNADRRAKIKRSAAGVEDDSDDREPFTPEELRLIFSQRHYQTGNGSHLKGNARWYPFEYWLPIIALHSGCRIKEVSQLHLNDISQSPDGVWYFDIHEATIDKSLKNQSATRQIPLSPVLIDLGLIEYRDRLVYEGFNRLFPELTWAKSDARYAKESVRKMSLMFGRLGMPRDGTKVFHCLRANFNDAMLRVPLPSLAFDNPKLVVFAQMKIIGHKVDDVNGKHYTSVTLSEQQLIVSGISHNLPSIAKFEIDFGVEQVRIAIDKKQGFRHGREDMGPLNPI